MALLKPRTTSVVLYQGDDLERLAELRRAVDRAVAAAQGSPRREGDEFPGRVEREAYDEFIVEAAERAIEIHMEAIGSTRFADLMLAHPPRMVDGEDGPQAHEDDADFGVNTLTFGKALLTFRDERKRTIVEPELPDDDLREFLDDDCADGDVERLWTTAYYLNRSAGGDPKGTMFSTGSLS